MAKPPSFFAAAWAASSLMSQITTFAPDRARRSAIAKLNPDAPPVTTAFRPLRSNRFMRHPVDVMLPPCHRWSSMLGCVRRDSDFQPASVAPQRRAAALLVGAEIDVLQLGIIPLRTMQRVAVAARQGARRENPLVDAA